MNVHGFLLLPGVRFGRMAAVRLPAIGRDNTEFASAFNDVIWRGMPPYASGAALSSRLEGGRLATPPN